MTATVMTAAALVVLLSGCTAPAATVQNPPAASSDPLSLTAPADPADPADAVGYPSGHVHGMSVEPGTERILLATHDELFDVSQSPAQQIGPTIDLMGFTSTDDGTLYASGHPGPGTDLPDPVGLITSDDGGRSWKPVSRQGETDFHSLAATSSGLVGYEGQIISGDGREWAVTADDIPAYNLAGASDGTVLATTEDGPHRSKDSGATWAPVPGAPVLIFTTFAGTTAVGVTPDGTIHTSEDAGLTWLEQGRVEGQPAAITAIPAGDGTQRVWVATDNGFETSSDSGRTFDIPAP